MKLSDDDYNFRAIIYKLIIIKDKSLLDKVYKSKFYESADSILTYCYVDNQAGITFEYLCLFNSETMAMFVQEDRDYMYKIRFGSVTDTEILIIDTDKSGNEVVDKHISLINENYTIPNDIKEFRTWGFIDHLRAKDFPDDIMTSVFKEGFGGEGMYVKLLKKENDKIFGQLLNEPHQKLGIHLNDIIEVQLGKDEDGIVRCYHDCQ
ncbi:MAG: hypothetical protein FWH35_00200 [Treponema sp.]|nr:hypothetical protein [Treponema sp.]